MSIDVLLILEHYETEQHKGHTRSAVVKLKTFLHLVTLMNSSGRLSVE